MGLLALPTEFPVHSTGLLCVIGSVLLLAYYFVPYVKDPFNLKRFPGPISARFSFLWIAFQARKHRASAAVHEQHKKLGDFVRLSPDHVSIAHPDSIRDVLGHGNGFLKSDFYYAFDNIEQGIFTVRDRIKHGRKRRYVSHMFSPKAMVDFEPYITNAVSIAARQMDSLISTGQAGAYQDLGKESREIRERQRKGEAAVDATKWNAYLAFDIIGDLAFGSSFNFCAAGNDYNNGIRKLRDRGEWCATVGQIPWIKLWTPYFFFDPFFIHGLRAAQALAAIGIASVDRRKTTKQDSNRKDILYWLLKAKDPDTSLPLPDREVKAEALTQMIAGSDTTGNTLSHVTDMLCSHPEKKAVLQRELDGKFPGPLEEGWVAPYTECKDLLYVQAVIYETLRLRTTVSIGLPRVVAEGGAEVCERRFEGGTVVSTPTYTVHRDERIWGGDAGEFRPERWLEREENGSWVRFNVEYEKYFLGFSYGPRACIGRNVAFMELKKTVSTFFRRFDYRRIYPEKETHIREGFHMKCQELLVFISKRE